MSKLHDICKEYDFCTPETRAELEANGFDFSVCKFGITEFIGARMQTDYDVETNGLIPYPTFAEVWRMLPSRILIGSYENLKCVLENQVYYAEMGDGRVDAFSVDFQFENENICESACLLWLKLKKGGYING